MKELPLDGWENLVLRWFEDLDTPAKLASIMLHRLLAANSEQLSGLGEKIFQKFEVEVDVDTLTSDRDQEVLKLCQLVREVSAEAEKKLEKSEDFP